MNVGAHRGQRFPLELGLQAAVNYLIWVLGIELRSSGRAVYTFNH